MMNPTSFLEDYVNIYTKENSKKPDFSIITLVILEFGGYQLLRLTEGFGAIAIRNICLKSENEVLKLINDENKFK